ncbi:hypothetical protein [Sphingomonas sp. CFBP 8760]|uniref:hypothetical protein n=1 Tax=Sphingomonas sp. CFBP 8760 TaxID=2775282 RepID=UPI001FCE63C9|nr:hypothetical protein [Sphingomonas sp. CFBP 8760]
MTSNAEEEDGAGGTALALIAAAIGAEQPLLTGITAEDDARVQAYVARASAASTIRAYRSD